MLSIDTLEQRKAELTKQLAQIHQQAEQLARAAVLTRGRLAEVESILANELEQKADDDKG